MPRKLTDEQIEALLDSRPGWAILSTIDQDGLPHTVPLGYFRLDRDIIMGVRDGTRKVANVESNPKVSVMLEDGSTMADIRGDVPRSRPHRSRTKRSTSACAGRGPGARCARGGVAYRIQAGLCLHPHDTGENFVLGLLRSDVGPRVAPQPSRDATAPI